ncbi:MAG: NAD(P)/FAD-dependent oxidoreductase [Phycisphaerae bacterium]|nr:NAD(P)/FAD-dependent oxidoreductase [Phycisphaerae bacterium]
MVAAHTNGAEYDVAIIGGGPGGTTTGTLLKKYNPALRVLILEREQFPRDHIGESQLPAVSKVLREMDAWEKIEAAGFPVKIGATYTWGQTREPWIFEFVPLDKVPPQDQIARPGPYEGWRTMSAYQVDRAIYDDVLLNHAASLGCEVRQNTAVEKVLHADDEIQGLQLAGGETIRARYYVDASGNAAILRRSLKVPCDIPTRLMNVAFWDYWEKPAWAEQDDVKATRVHIRSVPFGWIWFIRLSATRVSIGLVCPADYYKNCGKKPADLYHEALAMEKTIAMETDGAKPRGKVEGTTDWSFVVQRTYGKNWFLVGECAGFADPILAAGLTLTQVGARELAYTILELDRREHDRNWLLERYHELQTRRVRQHMRFAEFWYSSNGIFEDIRENCVKIAAEAGMKLTPAQAFQWLSQGGLGDDFLGSAGIGGHDLASMKHVMTRLMGAEQNWMINGKNCYKLNLANATEVRVGIPHGGRIHPARAWRRGSSELIEIGVQGLVTECLRHTDDGRELLAMVRRSTGGRASAEQLKMLEYHALQVLESMANQHWVMCSVKKNQPLMHVGVPDEGVFIHSDRGEARL